MGEQSLESVPPGVRQQSGGFVNRAISVVWTFSYGTYIGWILLEDVSDARDLQEFHVTLVLTNLHYRFVQVARGRVEHGFLTGH